MAEVERHGLGALRGQPARPLRSAGADLQHPASAHRTEQAQLGLGPALRTPDEGASGAVVAQEGRVLLGVLGRRAVPPAPRGPGGGAFSHVRAVGAV